MDGNRYDLFCRDLLINYEKFLKEEVKELYDKVRKISRFDILEKIEVEVMNICIREIIPIIINIEFKEHTDIKLIQYLNCYLTDIITNWILEFEDICRSEES